MMINHSREKASQETAGPIYPMLFTVRANPWVGNGGQGKMVGALKSSLYSSAQTASEQSQSMGPHPPSPHPSLRKLLWLFSSSLGLN